MGADLILCPLAFEAAALRRDLGARARIVVVGPGASAGAAASLIARTNGERPRRVVLAGLCGGLRPTPAAPSIHTILDAAGARWTPPLRAPGEPAVLIGTDDIVGDPRAKADLAARTGAALVDTESHHVARAIAELGVPWGVVRAVSDGPDDALPAGIGSWVDSRGRTRLGAVALACVARPSVVPDVIALGRRSKAALDALATAVRAVLDAECSP